MIQPHIDYMCDAGLISVHSTYVKHILSPKLYYICITALQI